MLRLTIEANKLNSTDEEQLGYAIEQGRVFFTHNRVDFESLAKDYFALGREHEGIIIAVRRSSL